MPNMNTILVFALAFTPGMSPGLTCSKPVVDLGPTRGGPAIKQTFQVSNGGSNQIAIVHVQPSCGCLAPTLGARTLKPGESTDVSIQIGTISQPEGDNLWTVRLFYREEGSTENQMLDLQVKAKLEREVCLEPAALRLSGKPGLSHEMTLTDRRAKPLAISRVVATSNRLNATMDDDWRPTDKGWVRKIRITLTADCPVGRHEEIIQVFSSDPDYRELRVNVSAVRK